MDCQPLQQEPMVYSEQQILDAWNSDSQDVVRYIIALSECNEEAYSATSVILA